MSSITQPVQPHSIFSIYGKKVRGNIADVSNVPCTTMPCGMAGGWYTLTSEGNTGAYVACERSDGQSNGLN